MDSVAPIKKLHRYAPDFIEYSFLKRFLVFCFINDRIEPLT